MFIRKLVVAAALTLAVAAPNLASAASAVAAPCILRDHKVGSVTPYKVDEHVGKATFTRLRGAQVFVQAEPGLTAEWLRLTLGQHLAAMQGGGSMRHCAFDVNDVRVEVESVGAGFSVKLIAKDADHAQEVLRRASLLFG